MIQVNLNIEYLIIIIDNIFLQLVEEKKPDHFSICFKLALFQHQFNSIPKEYLNKLG